MGLLLAGLLEVLAEAWQRATTPHPPPSRAVVGLSALAALVCLAVPGLWRLTRHLLTVLHEGAHAGAALVTGRRLAGIRLHSDTSGLTVSVGRARGPGMVATAAAGYPGPASVGLGGAWLLGRGYAVGVLWLLLLVVVLMVAAIRNVYGLGVLVAVATGLLVVTWWAPVEAQVALAHAITWFLLLGAPRAVLELQRERRRARRSGGRATSDADTLGGITPLPPVAWVALFWVTTALALVGGGRWVLRAG